ncbi:hypothetical protein WG66_003790 [Moniliophthora roreri]|nr:hypothetical protein WG66_003790 [Moniliophthora roreri]
MILSPSRLTIWSRFPGTLFSKKTLHRTSQQMGDDTVNLTDSELQLLSTCISNARLGNPFDYALTVHDEVENKNNPSRSDGIWNANMAIGTVHMVAEAIFLGHHFVCNRKIHRNDKHYHRFTTNGLNTVLDHHVGSHVLMHSVAAVIVAVRTWAIWEKNRRILYTLVVFSVTAVIPASIIVARSLITSHGKNSNPIFDISGAGGSV